MSRDVFTIGHGTSGFTDFAARLERHHIATIVDVRSQPYSKFAPDFQKHRLAIHAAASGYGYRWLGDRLGGRPADPALLDPDGNPDYEAMRATASFSGGLDEVEALARTGRVALLCAESDPMHCHRTRLIAPALEERGMRVFHILADGSADAHQADLGL